MSPSSRLKERDYSHPGFYFVTICANYKQCIFGGVIRHNVELTPAGRIVHESWIAIPSHFARLNLHSFVVMPNHFHGILQIAETGLAQHAVPLQGTSVERVCVLDLCQSSFDRLKRKSPGARDWSWTGRARFGRGIISTA